MANRPPGTPAAQPTPAPGTPVDRNAAGDSPDNPGPLATDLSLELNPQAIKQAMRKVADWQVRTATPLYNQQWTYAALYDGLLAASKATGNHRYRDSVLQMAQRFDLDVQTR